MDMKEGDRTDEELFFSSDKPLIQPHLQMIAALRIAGRTSMSQHSTPSYLIFMY